MPHTATGSPNLRSFGPSPGDTGGGRYNFEMYITECGDPEIRTLAELVEKQNYWNDPVMPARNIASSNLTLATGSALQVRFALQTTLIQCFGEHGLDAVVYPTGSVPPAILTAPQEPSVNGRGSSVWTAVNSRGFPAMTVVPGRGARPLAPGSSRRPGFMTATARRLDRSLTDSPRRLRSPPRAASLPRPRQPGGTPYATWIHLDDRDGRAYDGFTAFFDGLGVRGDGQVFATSSGTGVLTVTLVGATVTLLTPGPTTSLSDLDFPSPPSVPGLATGGSMALASALVLCGAAALRGRRCAFAGLDRSLRG